MEAGPKLAPELTAWDRNGKSVDGTSADNEGEDIGLCFECRAETDCFVSVRQYWSTVDCGDQYNLCIVGPMKWDRCVPDDEPNCSGE